MKKPDIIEDEAEVVAGFGEALHVLDHVLEGMAVERGADEGLDLGDELTARRAATGGLKCRLPWS